MAIDWETVVGAPLVNLFGDSAIYTPVGGSGYAITGIFDEQYRDTEMMTPEAPVADTLPVLGVNASQFHAPPAQNDAVSILTIGGKVLQTPKRYLVKIPRPDGHGMIRLLLNEAA